MHIETPLGKMTACATSRGLCLLEFEERESIDKQIGDVLKRLDGNLVEGQNPHLDCAKKELSEYFSGTRKQFTVTLDMVGTDFQKQVWNELLNIPYGQTCSYMQQTKALGDPNKIRAVASANGKNKIAVIIPCHRVIGSDGSLTGYAGGIERKRQLLDLESSGKGLFD